MSADRKLPKPMWGRCGDCDHRWIILYMPMRLDLAARVMQGAICPMCGHDKVFVAGPEPIAEAKPPPSDQPG